MKWEQEHLSNGRYTLDMVEIDERIKQTITEIKLEESEGWSFDAKDGFLKQQITVGPNGRAEAGYSYQLRAKSNVQLPF